MNPINYMTCAVYEPNQLYDVAHELHWGFQIAVVSGYVRYVYDNLTTVII